VEGERARAAKDDRLLVRDATYLRALVGLPPVRVERERARNEGRLTCRDIEHRC